MALQWSKHEVGRAGMKSVVMEVQLRAAREFEDSLHPGCTSNYG